MRYAIPLLCATIIGALPSSLSAQKKPFRMDTFTYKKVGDLDIRLDVHRADDKKIRPVAVWIHGGALIMGSRAGINRRVKKMMLDVGYVLVSIDYRLAPETKLPAIISDVEDAFKWIRKEGPKRFHADVSKIAVLGGSAGGYLTLATGYRVKPRPTVLVSFWGYGDLVGEWYSKPSKHARHQRIKMTREEALKQVSGKPISDSRDRKGNGGAFYVHCRQHGIWPQQVSGWDPIKQEKKFHPFMPVKNVTRDYPPTILIHGDKDTDVPYDLSVAMATQFRLKRVPFELKTIIGGEHGLGGGNPKRINAAYRSAMEFVNRHMGHDQPSKSKVAK